MKWSLAAVCLLVIPGCIEGDSQGIDPAVVEAFEAARLASADAAGPDGDLRSSQVDMDVDMDVHFDGQRMQMVMETAMLTRFYQDDALGLEMDMAMDGAGEDVEMTMQMLCRPGSIVIVTDMGDGPDRQEISFDDSCLAGDPQAYMEAVGGMGGMDFSSMFDPEQMADMEVEVLETRGDPGDAFVTYRYDLDMPLPDMGFGEISMEGEFRSVAHLVDGRIVAEDFTGTMHMEMAIDGETMRMEADFDAVMSNDFGARSAAPQSI